MATKLQAELAEDTATPYLKRLIKTTPKYTDRGTKNAAGFMVNKGRKFAPSRTGDLRSKIRWKKLKNNEYEVISDAKDGNFNKAMAMEEGTRPHFIFPRRPGGYMKFLKDGKIVFATRVNHPGTKAYRYMFKASELTDKKFPNMVSLEVDKAIKTS